MAQYKVLQDIEAEDKLLGPLSLRQFIYAAITLALGFVTFRLFMTPVWFFGFILLPPTLFFGLLSAPIGGQQSSEIWLLAKIRFFLMPRKRVWDQTGLQELVTITVPKKVERHLTKGYSQDEVTSRLKTLSATLDTRGWAVKNATNMYTAQSTGSDDRLLTIDAPAMPSVYVDPSADMLDPDVNPRARAVDQMIDKSAQKHRETVKQNLQRQAPIALPTPTPQITKEDEEKLLERIHARANQPNELGSHMKVIQPAHTRPPQTTQKQGQPTVTAATDPAILNLVENSEDLSVQTIARQAGRIKQKEDDGEVVISLH